MRNADMATDLKSLRSIVGALLISAAPATKALADQGFSIAIDGKTIAGDERDPIVEVAVEELQREADVSLEAVDVQVKFDGLGAQPILNVSSDDLRASYQAGAPVRFRASSNYPGFVTGAEVRIIDVTRGTVVDTLPLTSSNASVDWTMPDTDRPLAYVLRVRDANGRFDETAPLPLNATSTDFPRHETVPDGPAIAAGEAEDRTAIRNIPVYGGAITVFGRQVPDGSEVLVRGESVPIDADGAFVIQRILPVGEHDVDVQVSHARGTGLDVTREVVVPASEWFGVGLADLTVGHRFGRKSLVEDSDGEFDRTYSRGRLAFYLKGKIKGRYLLTAAADTREEPLEDVLRNFDEKDPRAFLRRIDPDRYYPVYGDDSTAVEDAPTDGKFYVRLERDGSHIMWGNSKTTIEGNEYARHSRALYGAHGKYVSPATTSRGEARLEVEGYASQPETLPQRDRLRGTGGSVYFLTRRDILRGSETLAIEVRDPLTGIVTDRRVLTYGEDYEINYIQGTVILSRPLASTAREGTIVTTNPLGEDAINLVAQYEYTPALGDVDGASYGGRAQAWLHDNLRIGLTGLSEQSGEASQEVAGADVQVRLGENSFLEAEIARSDGPGFGRSDSLNGGLTINDIDTVGDNRSAVAVGARVHVDLADMGFDRGAIDAYYARREGGFSSLDYETEVTERIFGIAADVPVTVNTDLLAKYEDYEDAAGRRKREGDLQLETRVNEKLTVGVGGKYAEYRGRSAAADLNGERFDLGARVAYAPDLDTTLSLFGQVTAHRSNGIDRNDRVGVGIEHRFTEKLSLAGEVSYGTSGWGGLASVNYDQTADDRYYIGYRLNPFADPFAASTLGNREGGIVAGARHRYNEAVTMYSEIGYDRWGADPSLATTYGVEYTPDSAWKATATTKFGTVQDGFGDELDRYALSLGLGYTDEEAISWRLRGEGRFEEGSVEGFDRNTYLATAGMSSRVSPDWRFLAHVDAAISDSDQRDFLDGDFIEGSLGFAYRPVENDRWNALFKYSYLYDLPGPDQVNSLGVTAGPAQRSHILSADAIVDVNQWWTLGAKFGMRIGEVSATRDENDFSKSSAYLGVVRADWHVVKKWDLFAEARALHTKELDTTRVGYVVGLSRHVGDNLKVGVGYNFAEFSDNVADLSEDDGGVFLNVIGKF
ncbi:TonB-dependent receptor [Rhizobiaceae bacterium]|nr:TonB-dependent receptor [Rhizobiaceae bacterium]